MIFKPTQIKIHNQQTIEIIFSLNPSIYLSKDNFSILSTSTGVSALGILSIEISGLSVILNTKPQFPNNLYLIHLLDVPSQQFEAADGTTLSLLDGDRNIYFVGVEDLNVVRDTMLQNLPPNYNTDSQTLVYDITSTIANEINTVKIAVQEAKNNNFISVPIVDELYYRGAGPTDRIKNEGAYKVSRVGKTPTGTHALGLKTFDPTVDTNIPFEIINLRTIQITETVPDGTSTNNFNGFLITLNHSNITKLISVVLSPGDILYTPSIYGYSLLNGDYDKLARPSLFLTSNQILLSPLTNGAFPQPVPGDVLTVVYEYDNAGRKIDKSSIQLYSVLQQKNENIPANITSFYLKNTNVVDSAGNVIILGGVLFTVSVVNLNKHPAFLREITFNPDSLPEQPGEYCVNYTTGQVFVFGTQTDIGTGNTPPVATYYYKNIAIPDIDYYINDDGYALTLNKYSSFANQVFNVSFLYEDTLIPNIDYIVSSHIEVLNERINNNLISDFAIKVKNSPVKDVYQILNETTSETYTPGYFSYDKIYFTGKNPPKTSSTLGEVAQVGSQNNEILIVGIPTKTPNGLLTVFPINLTFNPVLNNRLDGIGSNFNTSVQFTNIDVFVNEYYFNIFESTQLNLEKLKNTGDYLIDYVNGIIYLAVSSSQDYDIGSVSYSYGSFIPTHKHVLGVQNIGLGTSYSNILETFDVNSFQDGLILPEKLNFGYDTFDNKTQAPNSSIYICQLQDDFTVYTSYPVKKITGVYTQYDVENNNTSNLASKNLFNEQSNSFSNTVIDLKTYITLPVENYTADAYKIVIPDSTSVVKSIVVIDTDVQLLDSQLYVLLYNNLITKSITLNQQLNPTSATIIFENTINLSNDSILNAWDSFVDISGNRFTITSQIDPNTITVSLTSQIPLPNYGSQILDTDGYLFSNYLNIISVAELPDLSYIVHFDILPAGVLPGYQIKDVSGNTFVITAVQTSSVVVSIINLNIVPVINPTSKIDTQSILLKDLPEVGQTTLQLPIDLPITTGTNLKIGYVPNSINNIILAANNAQAAGGTGLIVDYSIGQYFIDYTHLDDELVVSYEWGDNQLDWSISDSLNENDPYYVSYEYGASRDGLETNFGPLTNVDFLQNAPLSISRETYRTAVGAAIKSFLKGPTTQAFKTLISAFTQTEPEITEYILNQWVVGRDPLALQLPSTTGDLLFGNGKFNNGLVLTNNNSIKLPGESSIRLAEGTFSTWFRPNWDGNQADEFITFTLPSLTKSVYYNAHNILPQDTTNDPWFLTFSSDSYGTAYVNNDFLEVRNSKNLFSSLTPANDGYLTTVDDGYLFSSSLELHDSFSSFSFNNNIGTYLWNRPESTLSLANDLDINFTGYVKELKAVDQTSAINNVLNVLIDDGYCKYDTGFYLYKKSQYSFSTLLEDFHLDTMEPFPNSSPAVYVSTITGSNIVSVESGDITTLSIGQQLIIGTAYPALTNIIAIVGSTLVMRLPAETSLTNVLIDNLDPNSDPGMQDGYGEVQLQDKLGTRPDGTIQIRTNGWERQLLTKIQITPYNTTFLVVVNADQEPLSTETPIIDFIDNIISGIDVFVDGYGNVFEIEQVSLPYVWIKKPAASGVVEPAGVLTLFRKMVGFKLPDNTFVSTDVNWSNSTSFSFTKRSGLLSLTTNTTTITGSYVSHYDNNTSSISSIGFGQMSSSVNSVSRIQNLNYSIHSIFTYDDIYIGNTGIHPTTDVISFKYDNSSSGIPIIDTDKYFAIFTSLGSANEDEPTDQVFIKTKIPSSWKLDDGTNNIDFSFQPTISFTGLTTGDIINIADAYGMNYKKVGDQIVFTTLDDSAYNSGNTSILLDEGPELRIAAGKRHYLFDVETPEGGLRLYRSGGGFLVAETQLNKSPYYNIRADIADWQAGQLHHIAMSWTINSPDKTDELHLFIDGDEVPNEITFGSQVSDGYFGSIFEEQLNLTIRVASSDGCIVNNSNGSGLFITTNAAVQPSSTWVNKTIILNDPSGSTNVYLDEPLIVDAIVSVSGGNMVFLSQNSQQIDFSIYGPSTPILYGLATSATAQLTSLTRANIGIFKNNAELNGPNSTNPQFRQVGNSQIIEFYSVNTSTGKYVEDVIESDILIIKTYGLLNQKIDDIVYQYGSLIRNYPLIVDINQEDMLTSVDVAINNGGPAFITDLPEPTDPTQITVNKILLPRVMI